jgi:type IV pilus assembly protein PilW
MVNTVNNANSGGVDLGNFLSSFLIPLEGFDANGSNTWSPALSRQVMRDASGNIVAFNPSPFPLDGTDIISVKVSAGDLPVTTPYMPTTSAALHTIPNDFIEQGDIVIVSDCEKTSVLQVTNANVQTSGTVAHNTGNAVDPGNSQTDLGKTYEENSKIIKPTVKTFYIANNAAGRPGLWELSNSKRLNAVSTDNIEDNPRELLTGVENMQISYGVDDDGNGTADRFVTAGSVDDGSTTDNEWLKVVSVRFSLLLQTQEDNLATEPQQYTYNSTAITAGDRRLRRVFTSTVGVRNRMP